MVAVVSKISISSRTAILLHKMACDMENSRRSKFLDALAGEPLAHVDAVIKRLSSDDTGAETTGEGITEES